jgi:DNA-binding MarR family transcriptional regulator
MHGSFELDAPQADSLRSLGEIDQALRAAREARLGAGSLTDSLWALLLDLVGHAHGRSFADLAEGPAQNLGRSTLMRCLAELEERGLVAGSGPEQASPLAHVSATDQGRTAIQAVLTDAAGRLTSGRGTNLALSLV